ncbi:general stress protein [Paenibacillus sp. HJGM_3]|uniref:general stress protein n=1 Tax=Paenibacillus sp. HJGM_3 TaxID=3379816 RepID=UPI00385C534F
MKPNHYIRAVNSAARAMEEIDRLHRQGIQREDIYVLAHSKERTNELAEAADINTISVEEEGLLTTMANLFRSRGDELRAKLVAAGVTESEARMYEEELDRGKVLIMVANRQAASASR